MPRPKRPRVPCPTDGCDREAPEGSSCNRCYQREWARRRNGVDPETVTVGRAMVHADQEARFRARIDTSGGPTACHPWIEGATRNDKGYGIVRWDGKDRRAHVVAWEQHYGRPMRPGFIGCHSCDNPPCCNPLHVYEGTRSDNYRDMRMRGRDKPPPRSTGVDHHSAKLTEEAVYMIRAAFDAGDKGRDIAAAHGVSAVTVSKIGNRRTWAHLPERR